MAAHQSFTIINRSASNRGMDFEMWVNSQYKCYVNHKQTNDPMIVSNVDMLAQGEVRVFIELPIASRTEMVKPLKKMNKI